MSIDIFKNRKFDEHPPSPNLLCSSVAADVYSYAIDIDGDVKSNLVPFIHELEQRIQRLEWKIEKLSEENEYLKDMMDEEFRSKNEGNF